MRLFFKYWFPAFGWASGAFHLFSYVDWSGLAHFDGRQFWTLLGALACLGLAIETVAYGLEARRPSLL